MGTPVGELRTALWHLRHGGIAQLREWRRRRGAASAGRPFDRALGATCAGRVGGLPLTERGAEVALDAVFPPYPFPDRAPTFAGVRAAVIMDDFSLRAWSYEFDVVAVTPGGGPEELDGVDLLLVESAWAGNGGAWRYLLTGSKAPGEALRELVERCRERGVPTVFWNKEDPPHFDDFLDTARLFDAVFTTDSRMLAAYRRELGHDRVGVLPFAAQLAVHNPVRGDGERQPRDLAFAGTYFAHKYPERREQMELLLGAAHRVSGRMRTGLEIFSRFEAEDERYRFPAPFAGHVVGSLPYDSMLTAYRAYKAFLNVNSVVDSPSMCARRVFEISASGTPVVTAPSAAIPEFFAADEVFVVDRPERAEHVLRGLVNSPELRDRAVHRAQRRIWREHTYAHRALDVLRAAGLDAGEDAGAEDAGAGPDPASVARRLTRPRVTVACSTNRPGQLEHVLEQVARQRGVELQLALLAHGFELDGDVERRARELGIHDLVLLEAAADVSLGACLNRLVDAADGDLVAKLDDDDLYGEHYLADQAAALRFSGADLVGKQAVHVYLAGLDCTVLRSPEREHRFTSFVAGPTLVAERDTLRRVRFADRTRGEDSRLLRDLADAGGRVYSSDRFGFVQMRGVAASGHTWDAADAEFLANGRVVASGLASEHVLV